MSKRGEEMTATVMRALVSAGGVTKAAGGSAVVPVSAVEVVVGMFAEHYVSIGKQIEANGRVIAALSRPEPQYHGSLPLDPAQWRTDFRPAVDPWAMAAQEGKR